MNFRARDVRVPYNGWLHPYACPGTKVAWLEARDPTIFGPTIISRMTRHAVKKIVAMMPKYEKYDLGLSIVWSFTAHTVLLDLGKHFSKKLLSDRCFSFFVSCT